MIRSKGVGVFFVTQNPTDIPDSVAAQLGNRIQHGLRAFTPKELKTVATVAETFRQEGDKDLAKVIQELQVGEAVVSTLQADGTQALRIGFDLPTEEYAWNGRAERPLVCHQ